MENISSLLESIATLTWPIIVIIIVLGFRGSIKEIIDSARSRKFTVKVAGNELSMEEVSEQQRTLITDLQKQMVELQRKVAPLLNTPTGGAPPEAKPTASEIQPKALNSILWVDDNPKNNAFLMEGMQEQGVNVVIALSTKDALSKFSSRRFGRVITDMGRQEDGRFNALAGIDLINQIRRLDKQVPIFVYSSARSATEQRRAALDAGAHGVTSSPTELLNLLQTGRD